MQARWLRLLNAHAAAVAETFRRLEEYLENPTHAAASRLNGAAKDAAGRSAAVEREMEGPAGRDADKEAAFLTTRALEDMTLRARAAVEEMIKFQVGSDRFLRDMARAGSDGCGHLVGALEESAHRRRHAGERVIEAKKSFQRLAQVYRRARAAMLRHPNAVEAMKVGAVYAQLHEAAHGGDGAAEAVGDMLVRAAVER
ncbi:MAG: hypothetical protein HY078_14505 [Elusimicrobia bacterium]|nr:hypothetical protein [Elusimicrobiota bacterium]